MRDHRYDDDAIAKDITRLVVEHTGEGVVRVPRRRLTRRHKDNDRAKAKTAKASRKRNR